MTFETIIEFLWRWLVALPALLLAGLGWLAQSPAPGAPTVPVPSPAPAGPVGRLGTQELATEQVCPGQNDVAKTAEALTCLTNNARLFHKLKVVTVNDALMAAAAAKNSDMARCGYGHTACGRGFSYWLQNKGYAGRCSAENIAQGQRTPREAFTAWMNSSGHRANILKADYRDIGVASLAGPSGRLWTMQLGGCK